MSNTTKTRQNDGPKQIGSLIRDLMNNPDFILRGYGDKLGGGKSNEK